MLVVLNFEDNTNCVKAEAIVCLNILLIFRAEEVPIHSTCSLIIEV